MALNSIRNNQPIYLNEMEKTQAVIFVNYSNKSTYSIFSVKRVDWPKLIHRISLPCTRRQEITGTIFGLHAGFLLVDRIFSNRL